MTRFLISLALLLLFSCAMSTAAEPIRVLTFNILASQPSWEVDAKRQPWAVRKPVTVEVMLNHPDGNGPYDFIGTQETSVHDKPELHQVKQLAEAMKGYDSLYAPCTGREEVFGLTNMIFWKKDRWEIDPQDSGTFWLSGTPDVPGSNDWVENNKGGQRCVTFGLFHEINAEGKRTGKKIYFYNTHLNVHVPEARIRSAFLIMDKIKNRKSPNTPILFVGDFNSRRGSEPVTYFQGGKVELGGKTHTPPFGLKEVFDVVPGTAAAIDLIFFIDEYLKPISAKQFRTIRNDVDPSDHPSVEAAFEWK